MKKLLIVALLVLAPGCGSLHEGYVKADRDTYDVFHKYIPKWIDADGSLSPEKKEDLKVLERSWAGKIKAAESDIKKGDKEESDG